MAAPEPSVCRKDLTRGGGWGYWHLRVYLKELCDKEYLGLTYNGTGRRAHYVLLDDAEDEEPSLAIHLKGGENLRESAGIPRPEN